MKYFTTEILQDWDVYDLIMKLFIFIFITKKITKYFNFFNLKVLFYGKGINQSRSHYNRSFTPAEQLLNPLPNFYYIWFKTDEISKRRSSYECCEKLFIWFSWETIFGFRYMFLVCDNSDFLIFIFNQKYPQAFLKYPKEYLGFKKKKQLLFCLFYKKIFSSIQFFSLEKRKWKNWLPLMIHNCTFCGFNDRIFLFFNRH